MEKIKDRYTPIFESPFKGNDKKIADSIKSLYDQYSKKIKKDYDIIIKIADELHLGEDEVEYYLEKLKLI